MRQYVAVQGVQSEIFPSEKVTTPITPDNLWRRCMLPRLKEAGLGWATFQVLRKTNASLSKKAGNGLYDAIKQLFTSQP